MTNQLLSAKMLGATGYTPMGGQRNYLSLWYDGKLPIGSVENSLTATLGYTRTQPTQWGSSDTTKLTVANITGYGHISAIRIR